MRALLPANQAALLGSVIFPRDFLEITARDRVTGDPIIERLWSDRFDITASVVNPDTGLAFSAEFQGASGLVEADGILFVSNLTVQDLEIKFSAYGVDTDRLFRLYDPQHAPVRIWRGF